MLNVLIGDTNLVSVPILLLVWLIRVLKRSLVGSDSKGLILKLSWLCSLGGSFASRCLMANSSGFSGEFALNQKGSQKNQIFFEKYGPKSRTGPFGLYIQTTQ
ncbi:hypothetical protein BpHYR1_042665 [Brachionus plicatilis]|uniref:Uncharacterized protein n=1 Tax=Brachionus plicatilis TaxID=10195 RepID=A0A3M7PC42_BRAPC|nr:hypothetical protein BpHYR1_042665 [Brachionus plicatilis]